MQKSKNSDKCIENGVQTMFVEVHQPKMRKGTMPPSLPQDQKLSKSANLGVQPQLEYAVSSYPY